MFVLFEVFLAPGAAADLLSSDTLRETQAKVMTLDEAQKLGFGGLPEPPADRDVRLIVVAHRYLPWIHRSLDANEAVASFRVHPVD